MERNLFPAGAFNPLKVIDKAVQAVPVAVDGMAADLADFFQVVVKIPVGRIPKQCGIFLTHRTPPGYGHSVGTKGPYNPHKNQART